MSASYRSSFLCSNTHSTRSVPANLRAAWLQQWGAGTMPARAAGRRRRVTTAGNRCPFQQHSAHPADTARTPKRLMPDDVPRSFVAVRSPTLPRTVRAADWISAQKTEFALLKMRRRDRRAWQERARRDLEAGFAHAAWVRAAQQY